MDQIVKMIEDEINGTEQRLATLRRAHGVLVPPKQAKPGPRRARRKSSARSKDASPGQLAKVQKTLIEDLNGRATQVAITRTSKLGSGAVSAAVRTLEKRGMIRKTGGKEGRSHEYEIVPDAPDFTSGNGDSDRTREHTLA
jgi:uncharacterized membrane protein